MASKSLTHVTLNPLDHFPPSNYTFFCSYLPLKDGVTPDEVVSVLQEGLRRTFTQLPWLSGKVYPQSSTAPGWRPGQLEIRYDVADFEGDIALRQIRVNHVYPDEVGMSYEDLRETGFPLDAFEDEQLITAELLPSLDSAPDCFKAQINFLEGACLLVVGTQHAACDGTSYFDVWKIFASNCEKLQQPGSPWPEAPSAESQDRTILDRIWEKESTGTPMAQVDPESWSLLDLQRPGAPKIEAAKSLKTLSDDVMQAAVFYVSPEKFSALQKHCAENKPTGMNISGNDALSALVWRCMLKAKYKAALAGGHMSISKADLAAAEARLFVTLDARPDISHDMPMLYLGNLFFVNICSQPLSSLTAPETSLGIVAQAIRSVLNKATRQALLDAYTLAREVGDLDRIRLNRGHTPNSFDMVLSSLLMFPVEGVAFGGKVFANGGRPDAVRPLMRRFNRASQVCFVLPRKTYGGVELVLNLFEDEMNILLEDEEFMEWCLHYSF
ncbi:Uu.00g024540.m01.CDS01 [Anthostomella pinea]|uniref:Uu.00g024540.m01.CDS01 n=1 Tax=Anthostomella pinea TaxID=933095 RepID=A0AAI8W0S7_9PEZI|nr:Uu.00g024540.m01.CDS01 [Anthostomella pinea]